MSITAYKDAGSIYPVSGLRPLTFPIPLAGGSKKTSLYLVFSTSYASGSILQITPLVPGTDFALTVKRTSDDWSSVLPNSPLLVSATGLTSLTLDIKADADGQDTEHDLWTSAVNVQVIDSSNTLIASYTVPVRVSFVDQFLPTTYRLLAAERKLPDVPPGFTVGSYRWRDESNGQVLVPTDWSQDWSLVGSQNFQPGIGFADDLEPRRLYREGHSVLPIIHHGEYFTGPNRYFIPSKDSQIEVFQPTQSTLSFQLAAKPRQGFPVYVGTYAIGDAGRYEEQYRYRYAGNEDWDTSASDRQFLIERVGSVYALTVNQGLPVPTDAFVDLVPPATDPAATYAESTFELPVYPVWSITAAYINSPITPCQIMSFDQIKGQLRVRCALDQVGGRLYVRYIPGLVAMYETAPTDALATDPSAPGAEERVLDNTELNPAFSGLPNGFIYLLHRRHRVNRISLAVDKPLVPIPATLSSIVGLVAYGPVYYTGDFAQLIAQATGATTDQLIPGAQLKVLPASGFEGFVNYQDPTLADVIVTTGGDGKAPMIYTPPAKAYGYYLDPTTSVVSDTITLPAPVALSQLWSALDGWYLATYWVENDDPVLGKVGANANAGEVSWKTLGTVGTVGYKTNGLRLVLADSSTNTIVEPIQMYDSANHPVFLTGGAVNPAFTGNVVKIKYPAALPTYSNLGAFFVAFVGRVVVRVQDLSTGVVSNSVMLQLAPPPMIVDSAAVQGYLYTNTSTLTKEGRLNVNRLGGAPIPATPNYTARY